MVAVAVLGLGRMGGAIAGRLLDAGHEVTVWNRTPTKAEPLVARGASAASTPADAAAKAELVITMLADPAAVDAVVVGAGVASAMRADACLVEMSTIGPDAVRALRSRLPDDAGLVDAPVMGSVPQVTAGRLTVLAGGDVERAAPVLTALGTVVRCGALGSAAALKLVLISAMISRVAVVCDALSLADALGVPQDQVLEQLAAGPFGTVLARARAGGGDFPLSLAAKDLGLALAASDLPVIRAALDTVRRLVADGAGTQDVTYLVRRQIQA